MDSTAPDADAATAQRPLGAHFGAPQGAAERKGAFDLLQLAKSAHRDPAHAFVPAFIGQRPPARPLDPADAAEARDKAEAAAALVALLGQERAQQARLCGTSGQPRQGDDTALPLARSFGSGGQWRVSQPVAQERGAGAYGTAADVATQPSRAPSAPLRPAQRARKRAPARVRRSQSGCGKQQLDASPEKNIAASCAAERHPCGRRSSLIDDLRVAQLLSPTARAARDTDRRPASGG